LTQGARNLFGTLRRVLARARAQKKKKKKKKKRKKNKIVQFVKLKNSGRKRARKSEQCERDIQN